MCFDFSVAMMSDDARLRSARCLMISMMFNVLCTIPIPISDISVLYIVPFNDYFSPRSVMI